VDYSVGGVSQAQITSAAASFVVDTKIDFNVSEVSLNPTQTHPGQTNVITTFTVTNTGNSTQGFVLSVVNETGTTLFTPPHTDNTDVTNLRTFVDSNGNGTYEAGADTAININSLAASTSAPGISVTVFVLADVPAGATNNQYASVRLTARATPVGSTTPIAQTAGADTAGVDVVWADNGRDNSESAADQYAVSVALTLTKSVVLISDPFGTTNPKAIPGAVMEYTILVTNSSTVQDATGVTVTDDLPANTSFQSNSIQLNGSSLPDTGNYTGGPPARVTVNAGTVVKNTSGVDGTATVKFRVTID